jgi:hypothetical protein
MKLTMKKSFSVTLVFILMITISLAVTKDDPGYKNLKILPKDITTQQLDSVMDHFSQSLGVSCDFCHVKSADSMDFAADGNKHKLVARDMMKMTNKINDEYFDMTGSKKDMNTQLMVTCFTCHHGKTQPEVKPK